MKSEQKDTLNLHTNVEENPHNTVYGDAKTRELTGQTEQLISREKIENTPFEIVGNRDSGYFLCMGKFRYTEFMQSKEQVLDYFNGNIWDLIMKMIVSISEDIAQNTLNNEK